MKEKVKLPLRNKENDPIIKARLAYCEEEGITIGATVVKKNTGEKRIVAGFTDTYLVSTAPLKGPRSRRTQARTPQTYWGPEHKGKK